MLIRKLSRITGKLHEMEIPMTDKQYIEWFEKPRRRLIQDIFPELDDDQREFLMTGVTPAEWKEYIADAEKQADQQEE